MSTSIPGRQVWQERSRPIGGQQLVVRDEAHAENCLGFVHLGRITIPLRSSL